MPSRMKFFLLVCILGHILSFSNSESLKYECPEPEGIFPCYCEEDDDDPWVFCNHFSKPDQMYEAFKGLKGYKIYKMSFFMNWILDPIKSNAFDGLAIERIVFENSTIRLTAPHFQGLEQLKSIQLRAIFNKTNPIIPLELSHHKNLQEIMFEKNRITTLPNDWLKSAPDSIRTITVEDNTIIAMEDEVFAKIKHLTFLILEGNRLVTLKRSMLPEPADDLRSINLNNNRIRYLPYDIFTEMPKLRTLEMVGNRLTTLDESIWSGIIPQLTKLDVLDNALECDSNLKWMYSDIKLPTLLYGECEKPEKLHKKSLKSLKLEDLR